MIEVVLEVGIDLRLHGLGEALLRLSVAITKVVAVAAGNEVVSVWLVGRPRAVVAYPVALGRVLGLAGLLERADGDLEDEFVGGGVGACCCAGFELSAGKHCRRL